MSIRRFVLRAPLCLPSVCRVGRCRPREDKLWQTDFAAAKAKAKAENKLLLVDFTGSDWCGLVHEAGLLEASSKEAFKAEGPQKFVLVESWIIRTLKKQSDELKKQKQRTAGQV